MQNLTPQQKLEILNAMLWAQRIIETNFGEFLRRASKKKWEKFQKAITTLASV